MLDPEGAQLVKDVLTLSAELMQDLSSYINTPTASEDMNELQRRIVIAHTAILVVTRFTSTALGTVFAPSGTLQDMAERAEELADRLVDEARSGILGSNIQ